jgi:hypothetical protein
MGATSWKTTVATRMLHDCRCGSSCSPAVSCSADSWHPAVAWQAVRGAQLGQVANLGALGRKEFRCRLRNKANSKIWVKLLLLLLHLQFH